MQCAVLLAQVPVLEVELSLTSTAFRNEKDRKARPQLNLQTRFVSCLMKVSFLVNELAPVWVTGASR